MLRIAFTVVLFGLLAPGAASPGVDHFPPDGQIARVSLWVDRIPLRAALRHVVDGTRIQLWIGSDVPDAPISLSFRDLDVDAALRLIGRHAASSVPGLTSAFEGGVFVVRMRVPGEAGQALPPALPKEVRNRQVSIDAAELPLRAAIARLFAGTGVPYTVDPAVPDVNVTLSLSGVGLQVAFRLLLRQAAIVAPSVGAFVIDRVVVVTTTPPRPSSPPLEGVDEEPPAPPEDPGWERFRLQSLPVEEVAAALGIRVIGARKSAAVGRSYRLDLQAALPPGLISLVAIPGENAILAYGTESARIALHQMLRMLDGSSNPESHTDKADTLGGRESAPPAATRLPLRGRANGRPAGVRAPNSAESASGRPHRRSR